MAHKNRASSQNEPSQRQRRVGEQLRHIIADTLRRGHFHNEMLLNRSGDITVTEVRTSPDLKHARAYVMSLGGENMEEILPALNDEAGVFQKDIGRQSGLKFTPRVKFVTDESFAEASKIETLLRGLHIPDDNDEEEEEEAS
ncbi:MAG: 30S ribosome-binding factor RbfA [Alphaproteobacteria bacterium]|nr:30S ribosome-binding factor RbfA [Alphaproteobacteria bacterium]